MDPKTLSEKIAEKAAGKNAKVVEKTQAKENAKTWAESQPRRFGRGKILK